jgi:hypothetical protein
MEDLTRLRELKSLADNELLSEAEFAERKMAIIARMLDNATAVVAELQAEEKKPAERSDPKPQGVGDTGPPPKRPQVTKVSEEVRGERTRTEAEHGLNRCWSTASRS